MLKRVIIDSQRHASFYTVFQRFLPDLGISDSKRKRVRKEDKEIQKIQGDAMWHWNDPETLYSDVEIFLVMENGKLTSKRVTYAFFCTAIRESINDMSWLQQIAQSRDANWHLQIPSFMYNILCKTQPSFCDAIKVDNAMTEIFSVGRYMYLQDWKQKRMYKNETSMETVDSTTILELPPHLLQLPSVILKMIFWNLVSKRVPQSQVLRYIGMLERNLENPFWWNYLPEKTEIQNDKIIIQEITKKLIDPSSQEISKWICFFKDLPDMLETFHGKPKHSKKTKSRLMETTTKTLTLENAQKMLINEQMWGVLAKIDSFASNLNQSVSALLFTEPNITTDQVHRSILLLFEEWGNFWLPPSGLSAVIGHFVVSRTSAGILLFLPSIWVTEIQERLLISLCLSPRFRRRYPVPVAPWLTEKYFSGEPRDKEVVIRTFYKLIHIHTKEHTHLTLASAEETELFWVYEHLHEILNHFTSTDQILREFKAVFGDSEFLYFQKKKAKKRQKEEVLVGIKNVACLQRALKSVLEIKNPHFLEIEGLNVLTKYDLVGHEGLPKAAGSLSQDETLAIYKLCAANTLENRDALALFYYTYTKGEILFTAKLSGVENWHSVSPFLQHYNEKMLKKIEHKDNSQEKLPCVALFSCFKIAEEMAHYPFQVTLDEYREGKFNFRGNMSNNPLNCDPRDFVVRECRCPLMLHADPSQREPRAWFSEDIFPIYEGTLHENALGTPRTNFANYVTNNPWKELRPFEDAHPHLLEYLVT